MRNRQQRAAGPLLPRPHPLPEILGVLAIERGDGQDLVGLVTAVAVDHVAVQVVTASGVARPLEPDEGRELARFVVCVADGGIALPDGCRERAALHLLGDLMVRLGLDHLHGGLDAPTIGHHVVPPLDGGIGRERRGCRRGSRRSSPWRRSGRSWRPSRAGGSAWPARPGRTSPPRRERSVEPLPGRACNRRLPRRPTSPNAHARRPSTRGWDSADPRRARTRALGTLAPSPRG